MGSSLTGSPSKSQATSKQIRRAVGPNLAGLMQPGAQRDQSMAAFTLDPAAFGKIGTALGQYSDPNYLDVASNPYTKNLIAALTGESNVNLEENLAKLRSQFAAQGQTGAGAASPLALTEAQTIEAAQADLNDTIAKQLFNQLRQQQVLQLQGLGAAGQYQMTPANLVQSLAGLMGTGTGASPGILGTIGQFAGGLGGAAQGLGSLGWQPLA